MVSLSLVGCMGASQTRSEDLPQYQPEEPRVLAPVRSEDRDLFVDARLVRPDPKDDAPRILRVSARLISPAGAVLDDEGVYDVTLHLADLDRLDGLGEVLASYHVTQVKRLPGLALLRGSPVFSLQLPADLPRDPGLDRGRRVVVAVKFLGQDGAQAYATSAPVFVP